MSTSSVPALMRQQVDRWAETWLMGSSRGLLELRAQAAQQSMLLVDDARADGNLAGQQGQKLGSDTAQEGLIEFSRFEAPRTLQRSCRL